MFSVWRLQLLREVARRGTLKEAAAAMSVSPSAVSQQLSLLEEEAGVPLLERAGRGVRLTEAGIALVRHADTITGAMAAAEADIARRRETVTGTLRIAAFPTAARALMPPVMAALGSLHPELRLTLRDLEAHESLAAIEMDEIDLAVVDEYDSPVTPIDGRLRVEEVLREPLYLAVPVGRSLTAPVRLADARNDYWIADTERSGFFGAVLRACRADGFEPHIRSNCKDFAVIIALVEAGLGVGVLPGLALHDRPSRVQLHAVVPALSRRIVAVVRPERRGHPAVTSALRELHRFGAAYRPVTPG
jgi:DNA-binding transcriptional LysR family regulator